MVKFYTFYEEKPQNYEVNDQPSLTDESFFEPLNVLVSRILRGESTTLDMSTANAGVYDYDEDVDDSVFDADVSDIDDLTDIDSAREIISSARRNRTTKSSANEEAEEAKHGAAEAPVQEAQSEQEKVS